MRLLVAIANHGTKNHKFVMRLIETYRNFSIDVDIVVLSNIPKDLGPDIEILVGAPTPDPWSLPFAHRDLFVDRQDNYDLFIYSEDDTEITENQLNSFCAATKKLPAHKIAGFIRYEEGPDGTRYYSTIHGQYYWDPNSILKIGDEVYARYTNDHSACYILTREQLKRCIKSGGFQIPAHAGYYDMLCSAATDPYTRCGIEKTICISDLPSFSLHHLPDIYLGRIGIEATEIDAQIDRMLDLADNADPRGPLFKPGTKLDTAQFDKKYFEPFRPEIMNAFPDTPGRILSIGCERGLTEGRLVEAGHEVVGIPLDPVIAVSSQMRGVKTVACNFDRALQDLAGERFDHLLFNNMLSHIADPAALIRHFLPLLAPKGSVVISFDNASHLGALRNRIARHGFAASFLGRSDFESAGFHLVTAGRIQAWMRDAGVSPQKRIYSISERFKTLSRRTLGLLDPWLARTGAVLGLGPEDR